MADQTKYFIVQRLWSNDRRRNLEPGETVPLDDLTDEQIAKLTAGNVIMLSPDATPAQKAAADQLAANDAPEPAKSKKAK